MACIEWKYARIGPSRVMRERSVVDNRFFVSIVPTITTQLNTNQYYFLDKQALTEGYLLKITFLLFYFPINSQLPPR
jgi:hypothetical protein